jgi:hypothetical protein
VSIVSTVLPPAYAESTYQLPRSLQGASGSTAMTGAMVPSSMSLSRSALILVHACMVSPRPCSR